jgi:hypothetical protein
LFPKEFKQVDESIAFCEMAWAVEMLFHIPLVFLVSSPKVQLPRDGWPQCSLTHPPDRRLSDLALHSLNSLTVAIPLHVTGG